MDVHTGIDWNNYESAMNEIREKFAVMYRQEETDYLCKDYLNNPPSGLPEDASRNVKFFDTDLSNCCASTSSSSSHSSVNEIWREKICEWSYQVVDHYDFNREVVTISLSYLDRFLATRRVNKKFFQLAAMTTLYLAIKIHEPGKLRMSSLIELSRGYFTVEHVSAMEDLILNSLSWRVHPPTPLTQVRYLLQLLPPRLVTPSITHSVIELSRFLTELSVCDYYFVTHRSSSIALASILIAMDACDKSQVLSESKSEFLENVETVAKISYKNPEIQECFLRLREMYYDGGYYQHHNEIDNIEGNRAVDRHKSVSPVNVVDVHAVVNPEQLNSCGNKKPRQN